jgi:hypothetical protein
MIRRFVFAPRFNLLRPIMALALLYIVLSGPMHVHAATVVLTNPGMAGVSGANAPAVQAFAHGTQHVYFDYTVVTPSSTDRVVAVVYPSGGGSILSNAPVYIATGGAAYVSLAASGSVWPDGGYCTVVYINGYADTLSGQMPLAWTVGSTSSPGCADPMPALRSANVPLGKGWNLLDVPLSGSGIATTETLLSRLNAAGVGAGAAAVYGNGKFAVYLPGYSDPLSLRQYSGVFVLVSNAGTWTVWGRAYLSGLTTPLTAGWSLVAAPFPAAGLQSDALVHEISSACPSDTVGEIATYSPASGYTAYTPGGTPIPVAATNGFWVQSSAPCASWTPS